MTIDRWLPDFPLVIWMVLLKIAPGLSSGMGVDEVVSAFNTGFGRALGEFALILLPKGALITAALLALLQTVLDERRACLCSAGRRSGSLLLVIGAARMLT